MSDLSKRISHLSSVHLAFAAQQIEAKSELMRAEPIAIIGMACRFPGGADDPEAFWRLLQSGGDAIGEVPRDRWDIDAFYDPDPGAPGKMCCRYGGFLDRADLFDADFFGISPREAVSMDPQQRLLLEVAWEALEHANQPAERLFGSPTGVFVGISTFDYAALRAGLRDRKAIDAYQVSGTTLSVAAGRLSYLLGLNGPCMSVDTACSSSLVGLHLACQSLRNRESALALAAGVGLLLAPEPSITFSKAGMLARDGRCKTFDAAADGYVRGEGCGVVVLKRLADALADGDTVLAVVRGSAVNQDGASGGLTVPSGPSQEAVIRGAVDGAGLDPLQISYVEAHGTGTSLGDPIEINALAGSLCRQRTRNQPLIVGSVKTNIGHLEAASGMAGVIKVVLALRHRRIPAQLHFKTPNPHMDWENMPIDVAAHGSAWLPAGGRRIAGVSAFGFSGTNAHVVLEEAPDEIVREKGAEKPLHLLTLSAKTQAALNALADRYLRQMDTHPEQAIGDLCYTANTGRSHFGHRLAVIAATRAELKDKLAALKAGDPAPGSPVSCPGIWRSEKPVQGQAKEPIRFDEKAAANDLRTEFQSLARAYVEGARIDWDHFYAGQAYSKLALPTYPFQRERFWVETADAPVNTGEHSGWPASLPGRRLHLPMSAEIRFESTLRGNLPAFLADHQLFGVIVVAGATYFAMLLQAVREALHQEAVVLEDVLLSQALTVGPAGAALVQTVIAPESQGLFTFHVMSLDAEKSGDHAWERHVCGKIRLAEELPAGNSSAPPADPTALREAAWSTWETVDAAGFYAQIARAGHQLGDSFRWIRNIWKQGKEALCLLEAPDIPGHGEAFPLYPGLIDSCLQFFCIWGRRLWAAGSGEPENDGPQDQNATYVPFSVGEMRFSGRTVRPEPGRRLWCHSTVSACDPLTRGMTGEIVLSDDDGCTLLKISGLNARKLTRNLLVNPEMPLVEESRADGLCRVDWLPLRPPQAPSDTTAPGQWLIFADGAGLGEAIGRRLRKDGQSAVLILPGSAYGRENADLYRIDPGAPADYIRLAEECRDDSRPCKGIIHLWSLASAAETTSRALENAQALGWGSVLSLVQALAGRLREFQPRLWLVTQGAQALPFGETNVCPHQALLWGLANAIRLEQPEWQCTCIDLEPPGGQDQAAPLYESIHRADMQDRIAIRGHSIYGARIVPLRLSQDGELTLSPDATYLITGGLGALGLATARWLASRGAAHLVLAGRSPGSAAAREQVGRLEQSGVRVKILTVDMAERSEVARMFAALSAMPPLKGIVHAAGVLADGVLAQQDMAQFRKVLAPKVEGAWNLHAATRGLPLDFFICYSSAAAVLGAAGQSNYAAANAYLDALAQARRREGLHGLSVAWGPWELGMAAGMDHRDTARIAAQGFKAIAPAQGFSTLTRLLLQDETHACVLPLNWDTYLRYHYRGAIPPFFEALSTGPSGQRGVSEDPSAILAQLQGAPAGQRRAILLDYVQVQVAAVLGETRPDEIKPRHRLFDLGIDSLMAVDLKNRLQSELHIPLEATLVFDYPTVEALVDHLLAELVFVKELRRSSEKRTARSSADAGPSPVDIGIEAASQDEIAQMLAMELAVGKGIR